MQSRKIASPNNTQQLAQQWRQTYVCMHESCFMFLDGWFCLNMCSSWSYQSKLYLSITKAKGFKLHKKTWFGLESLPHSRFSIIPKELNCEKSDNDTEVWQSNKIQHPNLVGTIPPCFLNFNPSSCDMLVTSLGQGTAFPHLGEHRWIYHLRWSLMCTSSIHVRSKTTWFI